MSYSVQGGDVARRYSHIMDPTQLAQVLQMLQKEQEIYDNLGFIKKYLFELGYKNHWEARDFKKKKSVLRKEYSVARTKFKPNDAESSDNLLTYILKHSIQIEDLLRKN